MADVDELERSKAWIGVACLSISALIAMVMVARGDASPVKKPRVAAPAPPVRDKDGCASSIAPPDSMRNDLPMIASRPTKIVTVGLRAGPDYQSYDLFEPVPWGVMRYVDVRGDVYLTSTGGGDTPEQFDRSVCSTREYQGTLRRADTMDLAAALDRGRRCTRQERDCGGVSVPAVVDGRLELQIVDSRTPDGATALRIYRYTFEL